MGLDDNDRKLSLDEQHLRLVTKMPCPPNAAATCFSPHSLRTVFQLYSVSPVHGNLNQCDDKREIKLPLTHQLTCLELGFCPSSSLCPNMCNTCANTFGPSSAREHTSPKTYH